MNNLRLSKDGGRSKKLSPYQKILHAARAGRGIRLTPEEVLCLSSDAAIEAAAFMDGLSDEDQMNQLGICIHGQKRLSCPTCCGNTAIDK